MNKGRVQFFADALSGVAVVERNLPGGLRYWDIERAMPTIKLLKYVALEAKKTGAVFLRLTPELLWGDSLGPEVKDMGFIYPKMMRRSHGPAATLLIDLEKDEKQLLTEMHPKTRYNIRVAERHGVIVSPVDASDPEVFAEFWRVMEETAKRDGIALLPPGHYRRILELKNNPQTILLLATPAAGFARTSEGVLAVMILV
ncbi:MAG: peptidoglycan bridge formation glycyltransferase FemA/FemB family protein, partial [Deltaproteobacteria bacterium]|nr:peptidoglycan bridge formation glycyltransferase FemA/FemB family protein [Deltaproteobacteria bacterium]